jgi:hypothetical protein
MAVASQATLVAATQGTLDPARGTAVATRRAASKRSASPAAMDSLGFGGDSLGELFDGLDPAVWETFGEAALGGGGGADMHLVPTPRLALRCVDRSHAASCARCGIARACAAARACVRARAAAWSLMAPRLPPLSKV